MSKNDLSGRHSGVQCGGPDLPLSREYVTVRHDDLLGMTNLMELHFAVSPVSVFQPGVLAHTPRLRSLHIAPTDPQPWSDAATFHQISLVYTPNLAQLSLGMFSDAVFSEWAAVAPLQVPHLTSLQLGLRHPSDNVSKALRQFSRLTHLTIDGLNQSLPEDYLSGLSNLSYLNVEGSFNACELPNLQLPAGLEEFGVRLVVHGSGFGMSG